MDNYQSPTMEYAAGDFQSENQRITTVIPVVAYRRSPHKKGMYTKNKYIYMIMIKTYIFVLIMLH